MSGTHEPQSPEPAEGDPFVIPSGSPGEIPSIPAEFPSSPADEPDQSGDDDHL